MCVGNTVPDVVYALDQQGGKGAANYAENVMPTLCSDSHGTPHGVSYAIEGNTVDRVSNKNGKGWCEGVSPTLNTQDRHAVTYQEVVGALCMDDYKGPNRQYVDQHKLIVCPEKARTLTARYDSSPCVDRGMNVVCVGNGQMHQMELGDKTGALNCMHDQQAVIHNAKPPRRYIVRRLTPLECCRLQGFPDWWEDGVEGSDSARYKMWGNGIALPCAVDVLRRISKELQKDTLGAVKP